MITVVITAKSVTPLLRRSIEELSSFPIILVGGGEKVQKLAEEYGVLYLEENGGKLAALKKALAEVETPWVFVLTGDSFITREHLIKLRTRINDKIGGVQPAIEVVGDTLAARAMRAIFNTQNNIMRQFPRLSDSYLFKRIPLTGDFFIDELCVEYHLRQLGYGIAYEPSAVVKTLGPKRLIDLLEQRRRIHAQYNNDKKYYLPSTQRLSLIALIKYLDWSDPTALVVATIIYLLASILGWIDYKLGKAAATWREIQRVKK